jgi:hypothetical protein
LLHSEGEDDSSYVANAQPHLFVNHRAQLLSLIVIHQNISIYTCLQNHLVASTLIGNEHIAGECLTILIDFLKSGAITSADIRKQIFHMCQLIGTKHKRTLEAFQWDAECQVLLTFIDGNKLSEENQATINRTREEMVEMEKRVVNTERNVENVAEVVKQQEINVGVAF